MTDVLEQLKEESLRLARGSFDSVDCGLAANVADAAIEEIERLRGLTFNDAQGSLTQEDIYANCWTTLIGFSEELTERDRKFICDQVARKVILAAQPPAAPVETDDVTAALNARQAAINEMMVRPRSSADRDREGDLDFSVPTTNRIMGAVRLHTHDHTMAYNITRDVLAVLAQPQETPEWLTALLECRDFIADLVGGAKFEGRAFGHAKELLEQADAALSLTRPHGECGK
jgi:hypothetical protein